MSPLAEIILVLLQRYPLSLVELMEDAELPSWQRRTMVKTLRQLEASGQVRRLDAPGRDEHPFYGRSLHEEKPGE